MGRKRQRNLQPSTVLPGGLPFEVQEMELATLFGYVAKAQQELLNAEEAKALHVSLETLAFLLEELKRKGATVRRLQAMLFGSSSEKTENVFPATAPEPSVPEEPSVNPNPAEEKADAKPKAKGHPPARAERLGHSGGTLHLPRGGLGHRRPPQVQVEGESFQVMVSHCRTTNLS